MKQGIVRLECANICSGFDIGIFPQKMKTLSKILIFIMIFTSSSAGIYQLASPEGSYPIFGKIENDIVEFWEVQADGTSIKLSELSSQFSLDETQNPDWLIPAIDVFKVSPSADLIAFSARQGTRNALFIYEFSTMTLLPSIPTEYWGIPKWSPDGTTILFEPRPFGIDDERIYYTLNPRPSELVYHVATGAITEFSSPPFLNWLPDSSGFYRQEGQNIKIADQYFDNVQFLNAPLLNDTSVGTPTRQCPFEWSDVHQKFYYVIGHCYEGSYQRLYSVDLNGNTTLEIDFFDFDTLQKRAVSWNVANLEARQDGLYVSVTVSHFDDKGEFFQSWMVLRINANGQVDTLVDITQDDGGPFSATQISPDGTKLLALSFALGNESRGVVSFCHH